MRWLLFVMLMIFMVSCDTNYYRTYKTTQPEVVEEVKPFFEGVFYFPNGGTLELVTAEDGDVIIESANQLLISQNPFNNTYGTHPVISGKYEVHEEVILISKDMDYKDSNQYDLEEDTSNSNITGKHFTVFKLFFDESNKLNIQITIFDGQKGKNLNHILVDRTIIEE